MLASEQAIRYLASAGIPARLLLLFACVLQVLANGDVNSPALERMSQLVQECLSLSAGVAVANPRGSFTFYSLKMDAASPSAAVQAPGQDFWARIVVSAQTAPHSCLDCATCRCICGCR